MKFKGLHPITGETLWGCPRYRILTVTPITSGWVIEWFGSNNFGYVEGETTPTAEELEWIVSNPEERGRMIDKKNAWLLKVDDIPF